MAPLTAFWHLAYDGKIPSYASFHFQSEILYFFHGIISNNALLPVDICLNVLTQIREWYNYNNIKKVCG